MENCVLNYAKGKPSAEGPSLTMTRAALDAIVLGEAKLAAGEATIEDNAETLIESSRFGHFRVSV